MIDRSRLVILVSDYCDRLAAFCLLRGISPMPVLYIDGLSLALSDPEMAKEIVRAFGKPDPSGDTFVAFMQNGEQFAATLREEASA